MSDESKPSKIVALANGRIPAELSRTVREHCGRLPASAEGVLVNFGRTPPETPKILAAQSVKQSSQAANNQKASAGTQVKAGAKKTSS